MKIKKSMDVESLQTEFAKSFPKLKLEAYKRAHKVNEGSPKSEQYESSELLAEISEAFYPGEFIISPTMTVALLEEIFEDVFGLHIQVFRKSGKTWLQTIQSDSKTLGALNKMK